MFKTLRSFFKKFDVYGYESEPGKMYGLDLNTWRYLGYTRASFVDSAKEITSSAHVFFFAEKDNEVDGKRKFIVNCSEYSHFELHDFIAHTCEAWAANNKLFYQTVHNYPSDWLKEYMLKEHNCEWDTESKWWTSTDKIKYNKAKQQQTKKQTIKTVPTEGNVVAFPGKPIES